MKLQKNCMDFSTFYYCKFECIVLLYNVASSLIIYIKTMVIIFMFFYLIDLVTYMQSISIEKRIYWILNIN